MVAVAAEVAVSESNAHISSNCNISGCTIPVNIMCVCLLPYVAVSTIRLIALMASHLVWRVLSLDRRC